MSDRKGNVKGFSALTGDPPECAEQPKEFRNMSRLSPATSRRGILAAILLLALVVWAAPAIYADDPGHIGEKPPNADGDGIPNQSDPDFDHGSRNGEQNATGDAAQGSGEPANEDAGDCIPNDGPPDFAGQGPLGPGAAAFLLSLILPY